MDKTVRNISLNTLRRDIIRVAHLANEGHIPSAFSILDILYVLYNEIFSSHDSKNEVDKNHFVLSKGHGSLALYAVLFRFNFISESDFFSFCQFNSKLGGHPDRLKIPGVEASTGSLGHGFPIGVGLALSQQLKRNNLRTFVLIGDGECNEGTTWESALFAAENELNNLICIVDNNNSSSRALNLGDICTKFRAFGWEALEIDGHNQNEISESLKLATINKPILINARTIKGKGISLMEHNPEWHHKIPTAEQVSKMLDELT